MNKIEKRMQASGMSFDDLAFIFQLDANTVRYAVLAERKTKAASRLCDEIVEYIEEQKGRFDSLKNWIMELKRKR